MSSYLRFPLCKLKSCYFQSNSFSSPSLSPYYGNSPISKTVPSFGFIYILNTLSHSPHKWIAKSHSFAGVRTRFDQTPMEMQNYRRANASPSLLCLGWMVAKQDAGNVHYYFSSLAQKKSTLTFFIFFRRLMSPWYEPTHTNTISEIQILPLYIRR